jgi:hypothetical protein
MWLLVLVKFIKESILTTSGALQWSKLASITDGHHFQLQGTVENSAQLQHYMLLVHLFYINMTKLLYWTLPKTAALLSHTVQQIHLQFRMWFLKIEISCMKTYLQRTDTPHTDFVTNVLSIFILNRILTFWHFTSKVNSNCWTVFININHSETKHFSYYIVK